VRECGGDERGRCTSMTLLSHGLCMMRRNKLEQAAAPLWSTSPCFKDSAAFLIDELDATSLIADARPGAVKLSIGRGAAAAPMACRRSAQNLESNMKGTQTEGMPAHRALQHTQDRTGVRQLQATTARHSERWAPAGLVGGARVDEEGAAGQHGCEG
jgi:hypothetical protein